jgi:hypothetical protein
MLYTLQALSEDDRKLWMDVMDGKEPVSEDSQQLVVCSFLIHYLQAATSFSYSSQTGLPLVTYIFYYFYWNQIIFY